ncbi:hypothetical protein TRVL_03004 [Trypanosoma vivax]|nr:hypothetical protein TRVL_03004 [Trypanosoma vivax]
MERTAAVNCSHCAECNAIVAHLRAQKQAHTSTLNKEKEAWDTTWDAAKLASANVSHLAGTLGRLSHMLHAYKHGKVSSSTANGVCIAANAGSSVARIGLKALAVCVDIPETLPPSSPETATRTASTQSIRQIAGAVAQTLFDSDSADIAATQTSRDAKQCKFYTTHSSNYAIFKAGTGKCAANRCSLVWTVVPDASRGMKIELDYKEGDAANSRKIEALLANMAGIM